MPKITVPVQMRWADIDGYGHVNNAAMLTLLEEARIATFWSAGVDGEQRKDTQVLGAGAGATSHTLVARQEIEYLAPLVFTQVPVRVDLWVGRIGGASLDVCYEVFDGGGSVCAKAATAVVLVDAASGRPRKLTPEERAALELLQDEPIVFRRR